MSTPKNPWKTLLERDDRKILEALEARGWDAESCYTWLKNPLKRLITGIHFNSQSRWGLQPSNAELKRLSHQFLDWMKEQQHWLSLKSQWSASKKGPWPMELYLSRYYWRFRKQTQPSPQESGFEKDEPSFSAKRAALEFPLQMRGKGMPEFLSGEILDAFHSLTHSLEEEIRLPYQLFLEGLLNHEIAWLMQINEERVAWCIDEAKKTLQGDISGKRAQ